MSHPAWHARLKDREPLSVVVVSGLFLKNMQLHKVELTNLLGRWIIGGVNTWYHDQTPRSQCSNSRPGHIVQPNGPSCRHGDRSRRAKVLRTARLRYKVILFRMPRLPIPGQSGQHKSTLNLPINLTSWNVLYYRLRANFDGLESAFCPNPPKPKANEGRTLYDLGKRCNNVTYSDQLVTLEYDDLINGGGGSVHADLVIAADGSKSVVRRCLVPNPPHVYSGYVAWRGTVAEQDVSEETRKIFDKRFNAFLMKRGYIVG